MVAVSGKKAAASSRRGQKDRQAETPETRGALEEHDLGRALAGVVGESKFERDCRAFLQYALRRAGYSQTPSFSSTYGAK